MRYYLIPDLHNIAPRDLYLIAFYADKMYVSDGLMFWKFFNSDLPLLSYKTQSEQGALLKRLAEVDGLPKTTLRAYSDLVAEGIIAHAWLGEGRWSLDLTPVSDPGLRIVLKQFNKLFKEHRVPLVEKVRAIMKSDIRVDHAQAINDARYLEYSDIVKELRQEFPDFEKYERDLRSRFDTYQEGYMHSERFALQAGIARVARTRYAGDLADVLQDLDLHADLCPIFASPEVSDIINRPALNQARTAPSSDIRGHIEFLIGLLLLQKLPSVNFVSVDEVLEKRRRFDAELAAYHAVIGTIASSIDLRQPDESVQGDILRIVERELLPAVDNLKNAVESAKRPMAISEQASVVRQTD